MDNRVASKLKNAFINIVNHRETNFILAVFTVFFTTYLGLIGLLNRNVFHPLRVDNFAQPNRSLVQAFESNSSFMVLGQDQTAIAGINPQDLLISTVFSLFALWLMALIAGRFMSYFFLPPLLGMLLIGILFANISFLQGVLIIHDNWNKVLQQTAFLVILIRCGLSLDPDSLRNSLFICGNLAIISTTMEVVAIVLCSHFIYGLPVYAAILFGYVLASTAPVVTVPVLMQLQEEGRGLEKGIPTAALASSTIGNIYCLTAFSIIGSSIFTTRDDLSYTLTRFPVEILVGSLFGILAGLLLRSLPRYDSHLAHFTRAILLFSTSLAFFFGTKAIKCEIAGPVAVLLACVVASMSWKIDNHKMTRPEERGLKIIWDLFFQPFLFVLIGLLIDFSAFTWELLSQSMSILVIALVARVAVVFLISLCTNLKVAEQFFLSVCFMPKVTAQAALGPILAQYYMADNNLVNYVQFVLQTCLLSILLTAPLGHILIQILGRMTMPKKSSGVATSLVDPFQIGAISGPGANSKYLMSDKDNRLKLEVSNSNGKQPGDKTIVETPLTDQPTFEEINKQAYEVFKKQKMAERSLGTKNKREEKGSEYTVITAI